MMPKLSNLRRASAWPTARLPWPQHSACAQDRGAAGRDEQSGLALPPPQQPQPASPASSSCSPSQTSGCAPGGLRPLALGLFRFRPAFQSPPISLCVWVRATSEAVALACLPPPAVASAAASSLPTSSVRRASAGAPGAAAVAIWNRGPAALVGDFDKIWREHCEDEETLCEYAVAMKNLADNHWAKTCEGEGRIEWCCSVCREYFQNGGKRKALEKDEKRAILATKTTPALNTHESSKLEGHLTNLSFTNPEFITELLQTSGKIRLLDVGSCFNPFLKFEEFLTVGIDIVPAVESVYKCDFLNLQLQQPLQLAQDAIDAFLKQLKNPIDSLPGELFHVVVFSLLLSYFPSPYQRWICCKKAHELLVLNGLLLIITPDSSHQNRHAMMMKSWKIAIESLGFKRFKYSKFSHMHLMAFRKISLKTTSDLVSRNYPGMLYIPQDFNSIEDEEYSNPSCYVRSDIEDEQLAYGFTELPDAPYDSDSGESQASSIPFYELEDPILLLS
nr:S-adenosylmethionine sensor upstream of mTORC1 [Vicugna pacos]